LTVFFRVLELVCELLTLTILLRAILSWVSPGNTNIFTDILYHITEPILAPLRRIIPRAGMIDFSPLVAVIVLQIIVVIIP